MKDTKYVDKNGVSRAEEESHPNIAINENDNNSMKNNIRENGERNMYDTDNNNENNNENIVQGSSNSTSTIHRTLISRIRDHPVGTFYSEHCIYLPYMLGWFILSATLSSYNKYVFGKEHMNFPCPLFITSIHFLTQWVFSLSITCAFPSSLGGDVVRNMPWMTFLWVSFTCGIVTSGDVGFSNMAIARISITFYTMIKASSPIFVLLSAYIFGIVRITPTLILVVIIISIGELFTVLGEVDFDLIGFLLCLVASALSGLRWTTVQLQLQTLSPKLPSTLATMRVISPMMFISMALFSCLYEKPWEPLSQKDSPYFHTGFEAIHTIGIALVGAIIAIAMIMCEFYLIMHSSAIVLMIGGVIKELTTIFTGVFLFNDNINAINLFGCFIVFLGVLFYKIVHHFEKLETSNNNEYEVMRSQQDSHMEQCHDHHDDEEQSNNINGMDVRQLGIVVMAEPLEDSDSIFVIGDDDDDNNNGTINAQNENSHNDTFHEKKNEVKHGLMHDENSTEESRSSDIEII
eukprot:CAMPEP_0184858916 /NCGR_PEP_ID=MMETSP0580-20130426/3944_1 /TAXON_ID=1118495 /ORGANISM="Dactyliosolen fragilissimus" /LENGTH=518 /DNA_ID=CAMNT_0027355275 /DNA_START=281 /DNA_END=1837 /DNA_ORIENTATION=+